MSKMPGQSGGRLSIGAAFLRAFRNLSFHRLPKLEIFPQIPVVTGRRALKDYLSMVGKRDGENRLVKARF
jgi:hypothetical protein